MSAESPLKNSDRVLRLQRGDALHTEHGAFHLHNLLGSGCFADVWRCRNADGEWRAVKIVRSKDKRSVENEAEVMRGSWESVNAAVFGDFAMLAEAHRRIPEFFCAVDADVSDSEGKPKGSAFGIVMEYVSGGSLGHLLSASFPLDSRLTRCIAMDIVIAVEHLHCRKIMHRDIKPDNILINREGLSYLTDFGVACSWADGTPSEFVGTPLYMAPEMVRRIPPTHDCSVDSWSFSMVCYEMMLGHTIWRQESGVDLLQDQIFKEMQVREDVEDLWKMEPFKVPGNDLHRVVRGCMRFDASRRWRFRRFIQSGMFFGAKRCHRAMLGSLLP